MFAFQEENQVVVEETLNHLSNGIGIVEENVNHLQTEVEQLQLEVDILQDENTLREEQFVSKSIYPFDILMAWPDCLQTA